MKMYAVKIRATVTKTLYIQAPNSGAAVELAHEIFTVESSGPDDLCREDYEEDTESVSTLPDGHGVEADAVWEED